MTGFPTYEEAKQYVCTDEGSGWLQLAILWAEGLQPTDSVLEIGCGALHLAVPLGEFLDVGNYVGIDPNAWVRQTRVTDLNYLISARGAHFETRDDFDARDLGRTYDYVFAHSVLSHATDEQLRLFLARSAEVLAFEGKIIFSVRLGEHSSHSKRWRYPEITCFSIDDVEHEARAQGLKVYVDHDYTEFVTALRPDEFHDWIIASVE